MDYGEIKMFCVWFVPNLVVCENLTDCCNPRIYARTNTSHRQSDARKIEIYNFYMRYCSLFISLALSFSLFFSLNEIN